MASHVVVIDSTARRAVIKTTPSKYLSDVLEEACTKLGVNANQYGLRNNNKQVDLSRTIRLSGLSSGAKLELIQLSRSPSVVSVALQLPDSEAQGAPNNRLTDKFSSTTTLWLILRKFESGKIGDAATTRNLTARGVPKTSNEGTGAGRLYYETPVLQVMGRELSSFTDLQKTLAQLGFNSGTTLLRLSFRVSDTPLEEAMEQIGQYFKSVDEVQSGGAHADSVAKTESMPEPSQSAGLENIQDQKTPPEPSETLSGPSELPPEPVSSPNGEKRKAESELLTSATLEPSTITGPNQRPISIFAPPSSTTPQAALRSHNEMDYEPTLDHAKLHQSRLSTTSRNKRLPTDAEIAAQQTAHAQKLAEVKEVEIKVRFPDQTQVVSKFSSIDTAAVLYEFVRGMLDRESEPFLLSYSAAGGPKTIPRDDHDDGGGKQSSKLIKDLGMVGRVLVNFVWGPGATDDARAGNVLKEAFREKAREIEVRDVQAVADGRGGAGLEEESVDLGKGKEKDGGREKGKGHGGVPKWLKLPGRK